MAGLDPTAHFVLVRTPQPHSDQYHSTINLPSHTHHLPVLSFQPTNPTLLSSTILLGPTDRYSGVIITSQRAVQAWVSASPAPSSSPLANWDSIPFFVVGPATFTAIAKLPGPIPQLVGATTGTGLVLANDILDHFSTSSSPPPTLPILYLTGDKNRETIPEVLEKAGFKLERQQVYETAVADDFEHRLDVLLHLISSSPSSPSPPSEEKTIWFALFSPSGAKPCVALLRQRGLLPPSASSPSSPTLPEPTQKSNHTFKVRLACIGPTTQSYLEDDEQLSVDAVALSPEPEELVRAIVNAR
ncbi:hypothetical protein RQP46_002289 [Phenoliferia psychrophenolica]